MPGKPTAPAARPALTPAGLRVIRTEDLGLSMAGLARALSDARRAVPRSTVHAWEAGVNPIPPFLMLALLELARRRRRA